MKLRRASAAFYLAALIVTASAVPSLSVFVTSATSSLQFVPLVQAAPDDNSTVTSGPAACTSPAPVHTSTFFHCYTPSDIRAAYDLNPLYTAGIDGTGETIVIVDSYGSPTALSDLQFFSSTFGLPVPNTPTGPTFTEIFPDGQPTFSFSAHGTQVGWAIETSLDLQWSHTIAPMANIVLVAANPEETEGVQGFPSIFKGEQIAITSYPGSVMSQSFAVTEQSFKAAGPIQVSKFDEVYQMAKANHVTVLGSSGDSGTANVIGGQGASKTTLLPFPTVNWPSSDPLVTSAGGTWLQYGWKWNPTVTTATFYSCLGSGTPFNTCAASYLSYTTGAGRTEAVWNEPFLPAATGGGLSVLFPTPDFQSGISSLLSGARGLPDVSWNSAVDGGVLVYTSFPGFRVGWHIIGGTSAASPQLAGLIALTNQKADMDGKANHVGYLNPLLYALPSSDFNDIVPQTFGTGAGVVTLDSNKLYGTGTSIPGMATTTGWDLTTGFGSPDAVNFVTDLASSIP